MKFLATHSLESWVLKKVSGVAGQFPTLMSIEEGFALAVREVIGRLEKGGGKDPALDAKVERILGEQG